jgi:hypothetical protein
VAHVPRRMSWAIVVPIGRDTPKKPPTDLAQEKCATLSKKRDTLCRIRIQHGNPPALFSRGIFAFPGVAQWLPGHARGP